MANEMADERPTCPASHSTYSKLLTLGHSVSLTPRSFWINLESQFLSHEERRLPPPRDLELHLPTRPNPRGTFSSFVHLKPSVVYLLPSPNRRFDAERALLHGGPFSLHLLESTGMGWRPSETAWANWAAVVCKSIFNITSNDQAAEIRFRRKVCFAQGRSLIHFFDIVVLQ